MCAIRWTSIFWRPSGARKRVTLPEGGTLDLTVPEGVSDGQVLRLKGKGSAGPRGGEPGDALVEIRVRPHPSSSARARHARSICRSRSTRRCWARRSRCRPWRAACSSRSPRARVGARVPPQGQGRAQAADARTTGDQLVTVRIVLPDTIDDSARLLHLRVAPEARLRPRTQVDRVRSGVGFAERDEHAIRRDDQQERGDAQDDPVRRRSGSVEHPRQVDEDEYAEHQQVGELVTTARAADGPWSSVHARCLRVRLTVGGSTASQFARSAEFP